MTVERAKHRELVAAGPRSQFVPGERRRRRDRPGARGTDARVILGAVAIGGLVVLGTVMALGGAGRSVVPVSQPDFTGSLIGPLEPFGIHLGRDDFRIVLVGMYACYLVALACGRSVPARWAIGAIAVLHALFLLAPVLLSRDIFLYIGFARLGALHGLNPYVDPLSAVPDDLAFSYLTWNRSTSFYGPLFTLLSYPVAGLGLAGAVWTLKAAAAAASLGCVALVWRTAKLLGHPPVPAAMLVGLNPLLLVTAVGGGHNDLIMLFFTTLGVYLLVATREQVGGAVLSVAILVKASAGVVALYGLAGVRDRRKLLVGLAIGAIAAGAVSLAVFGPQGVDLLSLARLQSETVNDRSIPYQFGELIGTGLTTGVRIAFTLATIVMLAWLLRWTLRGGDWIAASGWAFLAILFGTTWLVSWYTAWALPLAALSRNRRLVAAALALQAYFIVVRWWLNV